MDGPLGRRLTQPGILLLLVLMLAWALRLFRLADANIWWDEGWSVWLARMSLADSAWQTARDVHPPLHTWLLHGWRSLVGESEFALRTSSALLGTLTVAALYDLGRRLFRSPALPVVAALLLAVSRFHIWWSQELRSYVLGALLVVISLALTVRLRWRPSPAVWVGLLLSTVAAIWTLYLLVLLVAIQSLYWIWSLRGDTARGALVRRWLAVMGATALGVLPWLLYAVPLMRQGSAGASDGGFVPFAELFATLLILGNSTFVERTLPVVLVVLGVVALGVWRARHAATRDAGVLLGATLGVPLVLVWLVTTVPRSIGYLPRPEARYLLPFAPVFSLLLAWAVIGLSGRRLWRGIALAGLLLLSLWSVTDYFAGRYRSDDYASIAGTLRAYAQPGDTVLLHSDAPWPVFDYHWGGPWRGTPHLQEADPGGVASILAPLWETHETLWLVVNPDGLRIDPTRLYESWLSGRATSVREWAFGDGRLIRFSRSDQDITLRPGFDPPRPPVALRGAEWALVGWEQPLDRLRVGQPLHVALTVEREGWSGPAQLRLGLPPVTAAEVEIPQGDGRWRGVVSLLPPPGTPGRELPLQLAIDGRLASLGAIELLPQPPPPPGPPLDPGRALDATFGDSSAVRLFGYDLEGEVVPSGRLMLTLYWEAVESLPLSYKIFVHLTNDGGEIVAQSDAEPAGGTRPTTTWVAGDRLIDEHALALPDSIPPGRYTLAVGLYEPTSGVRLAPVRAEDTQPDAREHLVLEQIVVGE